MLTTVVRPIIQNQRIWLIRSRSLIYHEVYVRWKSNGKEITSSKSDVDINVKPLGEKVKETTKTASYLGIILLGVGVTGGLFYAVFSELFSSKSPNNVYTNAAKRCKNDPRIQDTLGLPIIIHGEQTRRGRRQHTSHVTYEKEGKKHLRMKFYLEGAFKKGIAQLEMVENDYGKYQYRYLFVDVDDMFRSTIVLEDNRNQDMLIQKPSLMY